MTKESRMSHPFFLALFLVVSLTGCAQDSSAPGSTAANPTASASVSAGAAVATPGTAVSAVPTSEIPDFSEDRKVYEQDQLKPLEVTVTLFEKDGATLDDVENDSDSTDEFEPKIDVLFQEGEFAKGTASPNATLKQRGHSTRKANQKSFQIKLTEKKQQWRNQRVIHLNKHPYDLTRLRNKLAFDLFRTLPHMGSLRTQFVHLTVKKNAGDPGRDYGLFTQIEHRNENYLANHGLDPDGNLYSAESFLFLRTPKQLMLSTDPNFKKEQFEKILESRGSSDHSKLLAMLDDVNNEAMPIDQVFRKHFNQNNYLTWFAMNILVGNMDTINQNFSLYSPKSGGWYFLPWDYDGALGFLSQPNEVKDTKQLPRFHEGIANWWESRLHRRFLAVPANLAALRAKVDELKKGLLAVEKVRAAVKPLQETVKPFVGRIPDLEYLPVKDSKVSRASNLAGCLAEFDAECDRLATVIEANDAAFQATLGRPMPFNLGDVESAENGLQAAFQWEPTVTLTGEPVTYDLQVAKTPDFDAKPLVFESLNLTAEQLQAAASGSVRILVPAKTLPAGQLLWRVIARSTRNPAENWQYSFETYVDSTKTHHGMKAFTKPN